MEIVKFSGDGILKKRVLSEMSQTDYVTEIENQRNIQLASIMNRYDDKLQRSLDSLAPKSERETWTNQLAEAKELVNATDILKVSTPLIDALISARNKNENRLDFANKIIANYANAANLTAAVLGERKIFIDENNKIYDEMLSEYQFSYKKIKVSINSADVLITNIDKVYEVDSFEFHIMTNEVNLKLVNVESILAVNGTDLKKTATVKFDTGSVKVSADSTTLTIVSDNLELFIGELELSVRV